MAPHAGFTLSSPTPFPIGMDAHLMAANPRGRLPAKNWASAAPQKEMTRMESLLIWKRTCQTDASQTDPFADPLDRPEWQGLMPLLRIYTRLIR